MEGTGWFSTIVGALLLLYGWFKDTTTAGAYSYERVHNLGLMSDRRASRSRRRRGGGHGGMDVGAGRRRKRPHYGRLLMETRKPADLTGSAG